MRIFSYIFINFFLWKIGRNQSLNYPLEGYRQTMPPRHEVEGLPAKTYSENHTIYKYQRFYCADDLETLSWPPAFGRNIIPYVSDWEKKIIALCIFIYI